MFRGKKRRIISLLCSIILIVNALSLSAFADYPDTVQTVAQGYIIYDATTGETILEKNSTLQYYPASITKIMTALLVCENVVDLNQKVSFSSEAIAELTPDSSTLWPQAKVGETMTIKDVLYGMFYISANECASQLAITVAGSREAFAQMMNDRAKQIGCVGTHFVNAHGLNDVEHYTTPKDMALIMAEALKNQRFFEMATGGTYVIPATEFEKARDIYVTHKIVNGEIPYAEVFAGKTGHTPQAGRTLVTAAQFGSHTIITVIMKSDNNEYYNDTLKLLEYVRGYLDGNYTSFDWEVKDEVAYVRGTTSLKVRDYPAQSGSNVVGTLAYGEQVNVTGTWGEWSQIKYMDSFYYVYSDYLTNKEPASEFDEKDKVEVTTREDVSVDFSIVSTTEAATTQAPTTKEEETFVVINEDDTEGSTAPTSSTDKKDGYSDMNEGPIKTVMIVCIVLMIVIAAVAIIMNMRAKQKRRRRREMRRRRRSDDFWR